MKSWWSRAWIVNGCSGIFLGLYGVTFMCVTMDGCCGDGDGNIGTGWGIASRDLNIAGCGESFGSTSFCEICSQCSKQCFRPGYQETVLKKYIGYKECCWRCSYQTRCFLHFLYQRRSVICSTLRSFSCTFTNGCLFSLLKSMWVSPTLNLLLLLKVSFFDQFQFDTGSMDGQLIFNYL